MISGVISGLDRATVAVRDLATAIAHYQDLLGRRAAGSLEAPVAETASAVFHLGNTSLELRAPRTDGASAKLSAWLEGEGEGLYGLAFAAPDVALARRELALRGLRDAESDGSEDIVALPRGETRGVRLSARETADPPAGVSPLLDGVDAATVVDRLDHVVVHSGDAEASRDLYERRLGLRLALDREFGARGIRILFFRTGGVTVEVVSSAKAGAATDVRDRLGGLAWGVADVDGACARLRERGVDVSGSRAGAKPGTRVATVRSGTHGVPTLLIGPESPQASVRRPLR